MKLIPALFLSVFASVAAEGGSPLNPVMFQTAPKHAAVELIRDGKPGFLIVAGRASEAGTERSRRSVTLAAEAVRDAFERITGVSPEIAEPAEKSKIASAKALIVLGGEAAKSVVPDLALPKTEPEGFAVVTFPKGVVISGWDGSAVPGTYNKMDWTRYRINGTANGAYDFLERYAGMRYYYPGIGVYAPKLGALLLPPVCYTDKPEFRNRYNWAHAQMFRKEWPWPGIKNNGSDFDKPWRMAMSTRYEAGHSPDPQTVGKEFPELRKTIFYTDRSGHLCYAPYSHFECFFDITNPAFADLLVSWYKRFYGTDGAWGKPWNGRYPPNSEYVWFGQTDMYVGDMDGERTKGLLPPERKNVPEGRLSDLYAHFYIMLAEKMKKELPGKKLGVMFYHSYTLPPVTVRNFPDNIRATLCMGRVIFAKSQKTRTQWRDTYREWTGILRHPVSAWIYGAEGSAFTKMIQGRYVRDFIALLSPYLWRDGLFYDAGGLDWHFYPSYYLQNRAFWNPAFDADAALDEHWTLLYGPKAGAYLREFYNTVVKVWETRGIPLAEAEDKLKDADTSTVCRIFDLPTVDRLESLLKKAADSTAPGSIERKRVEFFAAPWPKEFAVIRGWHRMVVPVCEVRKLGSTEKIRIDGVLDEPGWKKARVMELSDAKSSGTKGKSSPECRIQWDDSGIYLGFVSRAVPAIKKGDVFFGGDSVEFFFSPGAEVNQYYHFAFNAADDFAAGFRRLKPIEAAYDPRWKAEGMLHAAKVMPDSWSLELYIPFAALRDAKPKVYGTSAANFIFTRPVPQEYLSFSPTMGNNHNTALFGILKFMGKGDL